jgi:hypothetical protein
LDACGKRHLTNKDGRISVIKNIIPYQIKILKKFNQFWLIPFKMGKKI